MPVSVTGYPKKSLCLGLTRSPGTGLVACAPLSCSYTESPTETE
jgi:hypothetical protein